MVREISRDPSFFRAAGEGLCRGSGHNLPAVKLPCPAVEDHGDGNELSAVRRFAVPAVPDLHDGAPEELFGIGAVSAEFEFEHPAAMRRFHLKVASSESGMLFDVRHHGAAHQKHLEMAPAGGFIDNGIA